MAAKKRVAKPEPGSSQTDPAVTEFLLILHKGAKVKDNSTKGVKIADPAGLLKWLAKDRCLVTFGDRKDIQAKRPALEAIIRERIRQL